MPRRRTCGLGRRGINRAVEDDPLLLELAYVRRRDPSPGRPRVVASRVITEAGPVPAELRRRRARLHRGARAAANGEEADERKQWNEPSVHPEIVPDQRYLLALAFREPVQTAVERNSVERSVRGLAERGEGADVSRLAPVVDGLAVRDAQAPHDPGAVIAVEVPPARGWHRAAPIHVPAGHRAVAARVAIDLNGPDERAGVVQS